MTRWSGSLRGRRKALWGVLAALLLLTSRLDAQTAAFPTLGFQEAPTAASADSSLTAPFLSGSPQAGSPVAPPAQPVIQPVVFEYPAPLFEYRPIVEGPGGPAVALPVPAGPVQVVQTACMFGDPPPPAPVPVTSATVGMSAGSSSASVTVDQDRRSGMCLSCMGIDWPGGSDGCKHFCDGLYECLCCPDPCYKPRWQPLADAAFYVAAVRPVTQQDLRWDAGRHVPLPDRSEFFWARADGRGRGPAPATGQLLAADRVNYNDLSYFFEAAIERFSLILEVPYRIVDPSNGSNASGVGDIRFGGKSLLFDCELLQIGAQFLVYAPSGNASRGLGTGHFSLEPSLLFGLRMGPETYLQAQLSEWIPIHADGDYAGSVFHTHVALNHRLLSVHENCPLVGTIGLNSWTFQDGQYTDPIFGSNQRSAGFTYVSIGPGLRLFICNHIDIGFAVDFSLSHPHFADPLFTTELRWRF